MTASTAAARVERFRELHRPGAPLIMPNAWDAGTARVLAAVGCLAVGTTSSGFAGTLGRPDRSVTRDEALGHAAVLAAAVAVPVSADLENGYGAEPAEVAATVRAAVDAGLAGCSIEDFTGDPQAPIHDVGLATERIAAAVEAAAGRLVLTARAENHLHGRDDLADTIGRLQGYQQVGADVLYAPGLRRAADIRSLVAELNRPVNVLLMPGGPGVGELAELGVARISTGGALAFAALGALGRSVRDLLDGAAPSFWQDAGAGRDIVGAW
ncbi:isocitrate lyase/phosphoenolpyruvate mutase family protein [Frankia sp. AiPs1]|uniref:isocitrate lyase/PEP mutase family protein n=1 Tax=Frankia sp. AiPs1 TaxID=573493 RepID=UPI0020446898|nr:isocitrate lyase/phosphoenolpyruvate mutase family protein [Frankia sp. AiPs1]MCM3922610.1 isocitrate lyase/phosphoenolpyruvate mutase family protein [Frankia sp. AiPs1]